MPGFAGFDREARQEFDKVSMFYLGMVNVCISDVRITIRWSVNNFDPKSLDSVITYLLSQKHPRQILIDYHFGGWERRAVETPREAAALLDAAKQLRPTSPIIKPFVKQMSLADIDCARPMVQRGFRAWLASEAEFCLAPERPWRSHLKRTLVFEQDEVSDGLVYRHLGRDAALIRVKGRRWAESVLGKTCGRALIETPAGDVLSNVYRKVLEQFQPRFDHIRACIPRADGEIEWISYQRLLMPVQTRRRRPTLVCLSATTPDVSIPIPVQTALSA